MKRLQAMLRGIHIISIKRVLIYKAGYGYIRGGINLGSAIEGWEGADDRKYRPHAL
jgi:hypothetical protein